MKRYSKAIIAVAGVLVVVGKALSDGSLDQSDLIEIFTAITVAYGVYRVPNQPPA